MSDAVRFVDVHLEVDAARLAMIKRDRWGRHLLELACHVAQEKCGDAGAILRADAEPELHIKRAIKPLTGTEVILVACRWPVIAGYAVTPDL